MVKKVLWFIAHRVLPLTSVNACQKLDHSSPRLIRISAFEAVHRFDRVPNTEAPE